MRSQAPPIAVAVVVLVVSVAGAIERAGLQLTEEAVRVGRRRAWAQEDKKMKCHLTAPSLNDSAVLHWITKEDREIVHTHRMIYVRTYSTRTLHVKSFDTMPHNDTHQATFNLSWNNITSTYTSNRNERNTAH